VLLLATAQVCVRPVAMAMAGRFGGTPQAPVASQVSPLVPHEVPTGAVVAESAHTTTPVEHCVVPTRQGFGFEVQLAPAVQATQAPPGAQTRLAPHVVPAARVVVELPQTDVPVPQPMTPSRHGSLLPVHETPASQVAHAPAPVQTCPAPQLVPASTLRPELAQVATPVVHEMTPTRQVFGLVEQLPPATQLPQLPLLQVWPEPQAVPLATFVVVSTQLGEPPEQSTRPVLQGFGFVLHAPPAVQLVHVPAPSQTWLAPHVVPPGRFPAPSTHVTEPVAHEVTPTRHRPGFVLHAWPSAHATHAPALQT
jgi:hypothetical protein